MVIAHPQRHALSDDDRRRRTAALLLAASRADDPAESDRIRSEVVELNVRIALAVARRYAHRGVDLEDLEQTACEGLVRAVSRFDVSQDRDLLSYAVPTIRGEVQRYFRDRSWTIRPRRRIQELQGRLNRFIEDYAAAHDREPTEQEACAGLDISRQLYAETVNAFGCFQPTSTNHPIGDGEGDAELGDVIPDEQDDLPAVEAQIMLRPVVRLLSERDRRILYLRFFEDRSQRDIGQQFGIKQAQVSRVLDRIYEELREQIGTRTGSPPTPAVALDG